jgi:hypothetical protein
MDNDHPSRLRAGLGEPSMIGLRVVSVKSRFRQMREQMRPRAQKPA